MAEKNQKIGYVLRSTAQDFVAGTRVLREEVPRFGSLVRVPTNENLETYGIIYNITVMDDGLVQQLVTAENVDATVIADNRTNRNVPLEISILTLGYQRGGTVFHTFPARPPISLDEVWECTAQETANFLAGNFYYLEHIVARIDIPVSELLSAHIQQARAALGKDGAAWARDAADYLINRLRGDYDALNQVLRALGDGFKEMEIK
jgi:hypothetical protein